MVEPEIYGSSNGSPTSRTRSGSSSSPRSTIVATHDGSRPTGSGPTTSSCQACSCTPSIRAIRADLLTHLARSPDRQFTTLDCHDGIPVRPDLDGHPRRRPRCSTSRTRVRSQWRERQPDPVRGARRAASTSTSSTAPTTRRSAATTSGTSPPARSSCSRGACRRSTTSACWPERTTAAAVERTGDGRAINRHDYPRRDPRALDRPAVGRILDLVRLRNTHPAFDGVLRVHARRRTVDPSPVATRRFRPVAGRRLRGWKRGPDRRRSRRVRRAVGVFARQQGWLTGHPAASRTGPHDASTGEIRIVGSDIAGIAVHRERVSDNVNRHRPEP